MAALRCCSSVLLALNCMGIASALKSAFRLLQRGVHLTSSGSYFRGLLEIHPLGSGLPSNPGIESARAEQKRAFYVTRHNPGAFEGITMPSVESIPGSHASFSWATHVLSTVGLLFWDLRKVQELRGQADLLRRRVCPHGSTMLEGISSCPLIVMQWSDSCMWQGMGVPTPHGLVIVSFPECPGFDTLLPFKAVLSAAQAQALCILFAATQLYCNPLQLSMETCIARLLRPGFAMFVCLLVQHVSWLLHDAALSATNAYRKFDILTSWQPVRCGAQVRPDRVSHPARYTWPCFPYACQRCMHSICFFPSFRSARFGRGFELRNGLQSKH